jgi:hypothetical protein
MNLLGDTSYPNHNSSQHFRCHLHADEPHICNDPPQPPSPWIPGFNVQLTTWHSLSPSWPLTVYSQEPAPYWEFCLILLCLSYIGILKSLSWLVGSTFPCNNPVKCFHFYLSWRHVLVCIQISSHHCELYWFIYLTSFLVLLFPALGFEILRALHLLSDRYLLGNYYMPGTALSAVKKAENKSPPSWSLHLQTIYQPSTTFCLKSYFAWYNVIDIFLLIGICWLYIFHPFDLSIHLYFIFLW